MRTLATWRIAAVGTVLASGLVVAATPGHATTTPDGVASLGAVNVVVDGQNDTLAPLAQCDVSGQTTDSTVGDGVGGVASYGTGNTSCTKDTTANTTTSTGSGTRFELDALLPYGGPRIRLSSYQVTCTATTKGTNASWSYSGLSGISGLPQQIPNNYTVPIHDSDGQLLANAIFNEAILPNPNDGSITLNMLHFVLFPDGGPASGDIYVGQTACSPTF